jgi:hypothetical protein
MPTKANQQSTFGPHHLKRRKHNQFTALDVHNAVVTHFEVLLVSVDCHGHQEVKDPELNGKGQGQSIHDVPTRSKR